MESYDRRVELRIKYTEFVEKVYNIFGVMAVDEICERRCYTRDSMRQTLHDIKVFKLDNLLDIKYMPGLDNYEQYYKDWGLLTENGDFILKGRYCIPIRDIKGRVTAVVGWYPDQKKYVTTPTVGFVRDAQFFNIESYTLSIERYRGITFLVEGIFDTLTLRSLGLPCLGNMGLPLSGVKQTMLSRWKKVCAIPDVDKAGKGTHDKKSKNYWRLNDTCSVFVLFPEVGGLKDIDDWGKLIDKGGVTEEDFKAELLNIMVKGNYLYNVKMG